MFDEKSFSTSSFSNSFFFSIVETVKTVAVKLKSLIVITFNIKSEL